MAFLIKFRGVLQAVGFLGHVYLVSRRYGLSGYAKVVDQDAVEVCVDGPKETVSRFVNELKRGPPAIIINRVDVEELESCGVEGGFDILFPEC